MKLNMRTGPNRGAWVDLLELQRKVRGMSRFPAIASSSLSVPFLQTGCQRGSLRADDSMRVALLYRY